MKFVALYKAYRGGEFFEASLESIGPAVDGVVVVMASKPWCGKGPPNNCNEPLERWSGRHAVSVCVVECDSWRQEEQYTQGLATIREQFGEDTAVLIIDTDEIWDTHELTKLKAHIEQNPNHHYFAAHIYTYVRSPLYQVYPLEKAMPCVALQSARPQPILGRFRGRTAGLTFACEDVAFHHLSFIRSTEEDVRLKFATTESQEDNGFHPDWMETTWNALPHGENLHVSRTDSHCWQSVRVVTPGALPHHARACPAVQAAIETEDRRWLERLRATDPKDQLLPRPTWEFSLYEDELRRYLGSIDLTMLKSRMLTSYLELAWLACYASLVPHAGGRILEIGSGNGGSTACLALASGAAVQIDAVDPFIPYDEVARHGLAKGVMEGDEAKFHETLKHYWLGGRVNHVKHNCTEAGPHLHPDGYDLAFVDANHSYDHVRHDNALAWIRLKPGGVLLGHDHTTRFPGVVQAVAESSIPFSAIAGTSLYYARKP